MPGADPASPTSSRQENAVNGDHLWMDTSCSGELCYLGEDACLVKAAVSPAHLSRRSRAPARDSQLRVEELMKKKKKPVALGSPN